MKKFILFILFIAFTSIPTYAKGEWYELTSKHFILRTNANIEKAQKTIKDLERFRVAIGELSGLDLTVDNTPPLLIYAFRKTSQFTRALKQNQTTLGFYISRSGGAVAALSLEDGKRIWEAKGLQVLFHEYSHHVLHHYSPYKYPRWYDEGLGEYLSTMEFEDDHAILGKPTIPRFIRLKNAKYWVRLEDLIRSRSAYPQKGKTRRGRTVEAHSALYAQGWLLTHYLMSKPKYSPDLNAYITAINEPGITDDTAFQNAFNKSYIDLENELLDYWKKGALPYIAYDLSKKLPQIDVQVRQMSKAEGKLQIYEAQFLTSQYGKYTKGLRKKFYKALKNNIRPIDMHLYLAHLEILNGNTVKAEEHINVILSQKPNHPAALRLKSVAFIHNKDLDKLSQQEKMTYRTLVTKALKADNYYVPALLDYARSYLLNGIEVTDNALEIIKIARNLEPDNSDIKHTHISLLYKARKLDKARSELQKILDWTSSKKAREAYKKRYQELFNQNNSQDS